MKIPVKLDPYAFPKLLRDSPQELEARVGIERFIRRFKGILRCFSGLSTLIRAYPRLSFLSLLLTHPLTPSGWPLRLSVAIYQVLLRLNVVELLPDLLFKPTKRRSALRMKQMTRSTAVII